MGENILILPLLANFNYTIVLLTIVTRLHIRSSDIIHLVTESLYPFTKVSLFPPTLELLFLLSASVNLAFFFRFHPEVTPSVLSFSVGICSNSFTFLVRTVYSHFMFPISSLSSSSIFVILVLNSFPLFHEFCFLWHKLFSWLFLRLTVLSICPLNSSLFLWDHFVCVCVCVCVFSCSVLPDSLRPHGL